MEKTYQKSKHELHLIGVLTDMDAKGIRTLEALQREENAQIYTTLWFAMEKFVNYVGLRTKNHRTACGKYQDGNASRLRELLKMGVDLENLQGTILLRIMEKMSLVLDRPVSAQVPYCITICTNGLVNEYRRLCPDGRPLLRLDKPVGQQEEDDYTLGDTVAAKDNPEELVLACETVRERLQPAREQARQEILEDLRQLRSADQTFVYLCMYEQMRPRQIYEAVEQLAALGCTPQEISEAMSEQVCRKYAICRSEMSAVLGKPLSRSMVKHLDTLDREVITNKISDVKFTMPRQVRVRLKERQHTTPLLK